MGNDVAQPQPTLNIESIRAQFPVLHQEVNGHPLIYFDNAATNQKPQRVIDALVNYYTGYNSNIHRGVHCLAEKATNAFEETRQLVRGFINAAEAEEVIFTKGATDSLNLVANSYGKLMVRSVDEVLISALEHHANIVPWQILCEQSGATLKVIPITDEGVIDIEAYKQLLSDKTRIVAVNHVSNTLGTVNPIKEIVKLAHFHGAAVVVDGAQATAHGTVDVQALGCDFYAFSSHKMFGPTGAGVLYGKRKLLEAMPPYQSGGEMISEVTFAKTTYNEIPYKFEAGTPNIADVIGMGEAIRFMNTLNTAALARHEAELLSHAQQQLNALPGVREIGTAPQKGPVFSFVVDGLHPFDIGMMLDARGIAVRTGHQCTQPLMQQFGIEGTIRASFSIYNTKAEIDAMANALKQIIEKVKR